MKRFDTILIIRGTIIANDEEEAAQLAQESMMDPPIHMHHTQVIDVTLFPEQDTDGQEEEKEETQEEVDRLARRYR